MKIKNSPNSACWNIFYVSFCNYNDIQFHDYWFWRLNNIAKVKINPQIRKFIFEVPPNITIRGNIN
jgi:hypothetical protein